MEHIPLFVILVAALALLVTNRLPPDAVGLSVIIALVLFGQASPAEAFIGLAHPATLSVASVLVLSAGVQRTGVIDGLALWMRRMSRGSEKRLLGFQTGLVAPISAFLSNTATVAIFLPVVLSLARDRGFSPSKFLIPLSYASLLGGMCTLIGTSTNIVVSALLVDHGFEPFGMFEFAPVGLLATAIGLLYLVTIAPRLIPDRREEGEGLTEVYHLRKFLTEVEVMPGSHLAGITLEQSNLNAQYDLDVLEVHRGAVRFQPTLTTTLLEGDVILVRAPVNSIRRIQDSEGVRLRGETKNEASDLTAGGMVLAEAVVPPGSPLENRTLKQSSFRNRYGVTALALYHAREYIRERVGHTTIRVGDTLLLYGSKTRLRELAGSQEVLSVVQILPPRPRRRLGRASVLIVLLTVSAAVTGIVSLVQALIGGAAIMALTGCLTLRETYRAVDRRTIFLLAGMISLGLSMERTGAAALVAGEFMHVASDAGPILLLAGTYLLTMAFTEVLTNNACAVIMTPIAIITAQGAGLDPRPFAMAVAIAASASFLTPFGYQTNMFVYGPGGYRFLDFARVGFPLSMICWIVATLVIPRILPLVP